MGWWHGKKTNELANKVVYQRLRIPVQAVVFPISCQEARFEITSSQPVVDGPYRDDMKPVLRDQLAQGGLRLPAILNASLK